MVWKQLAESNGDLIPVNHFVLLKYISAHLSIFFFFSPRFLRCFSVKSERFSSGTHVAKYLWALFSVQKCDNDTELAVDGSGPSDALGLTSSACVITLSSWDFITHTSRRRLSKFRF